jgi:hypothetical protein
MWGIYQGIYEQVTRRSCIMRDGGSDKRGIIKAPARSGRLSSEVTSPECSLDAVLVWNVGVMSNGLELPNDWVQD